MQLKCYWLPKGAMGVQEILLILHVKNLKTVLWQQCNSPQNILSQNGPTKIISPTLSPAQDTLRVTACAWEHFPNFSWSQKKKWGLIRTGRNLFCSRSPVLENFSFLIFCLVLGFFFFPWQSKPTETQNQQNKNKTKQNNHTKKSKTKTTKTKPNNKKTSRWSWKRWSWPFLALCFQGAPSLPKGRLPTDSQRQVPDTPAWGCRAKSQWSITISIPAHGIQGSHRCSVCPEQWGQPEGQEGERGGDKAGIPK